MTGQKNRFKTHEKLWNIDDKQLKTPKHDALVLWLLDENNLKQYIPLKELSDFTEHHWDFVEDKKYYFDMNYVFSHLDIKSEVPLKSSPTFIGGYADIIVTPIHKGYHEVDKKYYERKGNDYLIEIKPYIDSFGAVLRQIKSYRSFKRVRGYWLFTLDERFDAQFESQGIRVIHPPNNFDLNEYMEEMGLI